MAITKKEASDEVEKTRTDTDIMKAAGVKIRNRLGAIHQTVEANVEGELALLAADATFYKAWLDRCPVKSAE